MPQRDLQPLSSLALHTPARIRRFVMDDPDMLQNSQERGLMMGNTLEVIARERFEGPLTIRVGSQAPKIIGHKMASLILVEYFDNS